MLKNQLELIINLLVNKKIKNKNKNRFNKELENLKN